MRRRKAEELIEKINVIKVLANDTKEGIQHYLHKAAVNGKVLANDEVGLRSWGNMGNFNQTTMRENMKVIRRLALDIAKQIEEDQP